MNKIFSLLLCVLLLVGCTTAPAETTAPRETTTASETTEPTTAPADTKLPLNIFVPNENADGFSTIPTVIDQLNVEIIVNMLIENSMLNEDVELNSVELVDTQLNLDFNQAFLDQLLQYGTAGERMLIGSVVNTFLSVYEAETVYITVNGEIMESGHVIYDFPMEFID